MPFKQKSKTKKKVAAAFKPVPKKILPIPETIHFGNSRSGPLCGAKGKAVIEGPFTCKACVEVWEGVMFDRLYGTSSEEDATLP
jgi:hypothetical protein